MHRFDGIYSKDMSKQCEDDTNQVAKEGKELRKHFLKAAHTHTPDQRCVNFRQGESNSEYTPKNSLDYPYKYTLTKMNECILQIN